MPLLKREGVKPLLQVVGNAPRDAARTRKPPSDIDPDASPISVSDGGSDVDLEDGPNDRPAKRVKISDNEEEEEEDDDNLRNPRKTKWKGLEKKKNYPASSQQSAVVVSSQDDEKLAAFDEIRSSQSSKQRLIFHRRNQNMKTPNIHLANELKKAKNKQKADKAVEKSVVSAKTSFKLPDDIPLSASNDVVSSFNAPATLPKHTRSSRSKKAAFQVPESVQVQISSSAPTTLRLPSSSSGPSPLPASTQPVTASEARAMHSIELDSSSSSPEPLIGLQEEARCPMCGVEVDKEFLESFTGHKKLRLKEAMDFCIAHKAQNAQSSWADSKYPSVNWDNFDKRLKQFNPKIRAILDQREESHFRSELAAKVASGQNRNALRNPEAEGELRLAAVTGYYGTKGARKMMEHVTNHFAEKIRKVATKDELFTEVGVSGFIQAVLVPELAVALVMDDFAGCDEARAREILSESAEVGDLVHAEDEEKVEPGQEEPDALDSPEPLQQPKQKTSKKSRKKAKR